MDFILRFRLLLFVLGFALFVVSERYLQHLVYHLYVVIGAFVIMVATSLLVALKALKTSRSQQAGEAKCWWLILSWKLAVILGAGVFLAYSHKIGNASSPEDFAGKALLTGWLLLLILGSIAGIGLEITYKGAGRADFAEPQRLRRAGFAWVLVGMLLSILVSLNYIGAKKDKVSDWSYLKATTPSDATINMFRAAPEEIKFSVFYAHDSDVLPYVKDYADYLKANVAGLNLNYYDVYSNPTQAEENKASRNGQIVMMFKDKRERVDIGRKLKSARSVLKKLDKEVQRAFLRLTEEQKRLYFTRGHGEMSWLSGRETDGLNSLKLLEGFLRSQNYSLRFFGVGDGSTKEVPDDAAAVVIVGPQEPFLDEEVDVLRRYVDGGGRLLVFMDVGRVGHDKPKLVDHAADPLRKFLADVGLSYKTELLANDKEFVSATRSPADHWFLFSNSFSSHESVTTLAKDEERVAVIGFQMGHFDVSERKGDWRAYSTVRSSNDTFVDLNKNFNFDKGKEKRKTYAMGAAAVRKIDDDTDARIIAFSDANAFSDVLIRNRANAVFVLDSVKWLAGKSNIQGDISSEEDIKIRHSNKEEAIWFNATVVVMPVVVLAAGFFATRTRKRRKG